MVFNSVFKGLNVKGDTLQRNLLALAAQQELGKRSATRAASEQKSDKLPLEIICSAQQW